MATPVMPSAWASGESTSTPEAKIHAGDEERTGGEGMLRAASYDVP